MYLCTYLCVYVDPIYGWMDGEHMWSYTVKWIAMPWFSPRFYP